ncbi:hypothetical protein CDAR_560381 [Caerostris darwini]|uniref:Uncharacterized protein n=1 Tax=Caerostris darwini TaxID=1538125 RepID=A0AAV4W186_9ARAC|nr:hypothetical protein CDAR_560121 [Caerostris darwini]GIY75674.1 hypothetical protein CDAR_560381 [Caerostris darwini]
MLKTILFAFRVLCSRFGIVVWKRRRDDELGWSMELHGGGYGLSIRMLLNNSDVRHESRPIPLLKRDITPSGVTLLMRDISTYD